MDELEARIRAARPGVATRSMPLGARAEDDLARLLASATPEPEPTRGTLRSTRLMRVAAVLVVSLATLVAVPWVISTPAAAHTPPPLELTAASAGVEEVAMAASDRLRGVAGPHAAERRSDSTGWYLHIDYRADLTSKVAISPEVTSLTWRADLSGRRVITAGVPYWADGSRSPVDSRGAREPGTVLFDTVYRPGEFEPAVTDTPGNDAESTLAFLRAYGMPETPSASDVMQATLFAFMDWTLSNEQHAHILNLLVATNEAAVAGSGMDRIDRPITAIAANSTANPDFRYLLLVSERTGRIVGVETTRRFPSDDLPAGAVTSYTLWDAEST